MAVKLYLNIANTPYSPTPKGAWNLVGGTTILPLGTDPFGTGITSIAVNEDTIVSPYSALMLRGISSKLQAQNISGTLDVIIGVGENSADAEFFWHLHVWVTQGNTDLVRGVLLDNYKEVTNEWPPGSFVGTARALAAPAALSSVGALAGDRIVVELGYISRNVLTSSKTGTMWYGSKLPPLFEPVVDLAIGGTDVARQAGTITFSQDILFESVTSQISHIQSQVVDEAAGAPARHAHTVIQAAQVTSPTARIAHILIQVVQGAATPVVPGLDLSGIYTIEPNKVERHDSYYQNIERKIPDPTIRTALIGE